MPPLVPTEGKDHAKARAMRGALDAGERRQLEAIGRKLAARQGE